MLASRAVLPVFATSLIALLGVLGLGHLLARLVAPEASAPVKGMLGLFVLAATGTTLNLVAPVGPWVAAAALAVGLASFGRSARRILAGTPPSTVFILVLLLAGASFANDFPSRHYDLGLYWMQAVKWVAESRLPLGLASLHSRLGFNSSWFSVAAMLEHPLTTGRSTFIAATVIVLLGAWHSAAGLRAVLTGRATFDSLLPASSGLVVVACAAALGGHSPDAAAAILGFTCLASWASAFEADESRQSSFSVAIILAAFAFTVKLSSVVLLGAAPALAFVLHRRAPGAVSLRPGLVASAVLLVPWGVRGYLASGCPLFPSTVGCLRLPWSTPQSVAVDVSRWIRSWARAPGQSPDVTLSDWDWLGPWALAGWEIPTVRLILLLLASGLAGTFLLRRRASPGFTPVALVAALGVVFWFMSAPAWPFGLAYLFGLVLALNCEALVRGLACTRSRWLRAGAGAAAAASLLVLGNDSVGWMATLPTESFSVVQWPAIPEGLQLTREAVTRGGARVRVPVFTDQCWGAPLPCTPSPDPGLSHDGWFRIGSTGPPDE